MIFFIKTNSFHQIIPKKEITILFFMKNPKNNNIILVISISISPIQWFQISEKNIASNQ